MTLGQLEFLGGFIDDLLDLGMLKSGTFSLKAESFDILSVVRLILKIFGPQAKAKNVKMRATVQQVEVYDSELASDELPQLPKLIGDERRIKQIMINLIRNALKFTQAGFISLQVIYNGWPSNKLTIAVQDTGVGISAEERPSLFTRFGKLLRTASIN